MSSVLLLLVAAAGPWVVHLAPPRQRALALVGFVAVLLIWGIFIRNPLTTWWFWVGLVIGLASVLFVGRSGTALRRPAGRTRLGRDSSADPTREL